MSEHFHLAIDLGAESGRVMLGRLADDRLELKEVHRFPTGFASREGGLFWKIREMESEIHSGLREVERRNLTISSLSTDSWGVDYVLVDEEGDPLAEPRCYRDPRNVESVPRVLEKISAPDLYTETGIPPAAINTLFQLEAEAHEDPRLLARANRLLMIADYFNFRFSGVPVAEVSLLSTSQLYNPRHGTWSEKIIALLGLPKSLLPPIVPSGTVLGLPARLGRLFPALQSSQVVASCSHDTGAAIAAVPTLSGKNWAYLSSGTWSILGVETDKPCLTEKARAAGFTHEVGLNGSVQLLKNIAGLWIVQECNRAWQKEGKIYSYQELVSLARFEPPSRSHIQIEDPRFLSPGSMPEKIASFCRETDQPVPASPGACIRLVLESLALFYAQTLTQLEALTGRKYSVLHLVGGGGKNDLLNQLTASAAGITVVAGPVEATTAGNILIQAMALNQIKSPLHLRAIVVASFPISQFEPANDFSESTRSSFEELFLAQAS